MRIILGTIVIACTLCSSAASSQVPLPTHFAIAPMANMSRPSDLDFQGGGCDIDAAGDTMTCSFQQVLLTLVPNDATTCLITSNQYEQTFKRQDARRWVSNQGPDGECGVVAVTTLEQDEGSLAVLWRVTINMRKIVTNKDPNVASRCGTLDEMPETLSSTQVGRPISCKMVKGSSLGL